MIIRDTKNQHILLLLTISIVMTGLWIGFELARSAFKSTIPEIVEEQMRALNPKINTGTLEKLPDRIHINEAQIQEILDKSAASVPQQLAMPELSSPSIATQSALASPASTPSGEL